MKEATSLDFNVIGYRVDSMAVAFLFIAALIVLFFYHAHKYKDTEFNVYDLFMEDGKTSSKKVIFIGSFIVSSWVIVHKELTAALDATVFGAFLAAWVAPVVANLFSTKAPTAGGK